MMERKEVLGESDGLGTADPRVVVGIGVNGDWAAADFPEELTGSMTSLRELAGMAIDHEAVLDVFLAELEPAVDGLRSGEFDGETWAARQATTGREIDLIAPNGSRTTVRATGVDRTSGALLLGDRTVLVGEVEHVRLSAPDGMAV